MKGRRRKAKVGTRKAAPRRPAGRARQRGVQTTEAITSLKRALAESLERQAATAEILKVISSSRGQLEPVFEAMLENAVRICGAKFGNLWLREGDGFRAAAMHNAPAALAEERRRAPVIYPTSPRHVLRRVAKTRKTVQVPDLLADKDATIHVATLGGARTIISVPMLKDGELVGAIGIYRQEIRPFTEKQIELVSNFAAQAVIAIENARLLNELRQRTDDLSETLEQQTATSNILSVISSSPTDVQPTLDAIVRTAVSLCNSHDAVILLRDGDYLGIAAHHGPMAIDFKGAPLGRDWVAGRTVVDRAPVHVADLTAEAAEFPIGAKIAARLKQRTVLGLPLLREGQAIGCLFLRRTEIRPFSGKQIALLQTFAAQAVIAIENTRLFAELRQRTDDLSEALEQQTATSEVLKVISRSPGDLVPVFQAMLANATRLCEARFGVLWLYDGKAFQLAATHGVPAALMDVIEKRGPNMAPPGSPLRRLLDTGDLVHTADELAEPLPGVAARFGGARSLLAVPMRKDSGLVGAFIIYRQEVRPFADKQIALVTNFAAQAVIAIENTRLLSELRQRTDDLSEALEQQTATSEVLKVISSSPGSLAPVFLSILTNATHICEAKYGMLWLTDGDGFRSVATHDVPAALAAEREREQIIYPGEDVPLGRIKRTKELVHIADIRTDRAYQTGFRPFVALVELGGARTLLLVPMLKDDAARRRDRDLPPGGPAVHRQADRAGAELRRAGRHRHREHAAAQRTAPAHRRSHRVAGAADRDLRGAEGHQLLARRPGAGVPGHAGECDAHLRGKVRHHVQASMATYFIRCLR